MSEIFLDLAFATQALRRMVERQATGLSGALGVGADPYPHQVGNVHRILTDTRVRHLIADEVGLGKTIQALMILNALRIQNPKHRALVLAPSELLQQWWHECQTRGHVIALDAPPTSENTEWYVRLAWPESLRVVSEINPDLYDLLVVDEMPRLQASIRQRVTEVANRFRQVLILTATPRLDDIESLRQLLVILEPERAALASLDRAGEPVEKFLAAAEARAADLLRRGSREDWRAEGAVPPECRRAEAVAVTHCMYRHVVHARRVDYAGLLPRREHINIAVEPTEQEVERQRLIWRYLQSAPDTSEEGRRGLDRERLAQVALRSSRALRERVGALRRRRASDPDDLLADVLKCTDTESGDSRLDALADILLEIWNRDPTNAVLVVAEDNPTVDHLSRHLALRLPTVGPAGRRRPLRIAKKRNRDEAASADIAVHYHELDEALDDFVAGEAQLLIAADVAQVGLNLQIARTIIFYSIPWSPQTVEQWIGRLDRLGYPPNATNQDSVQKTIEVYTIVQRGQVEERIATVLDAFAVFRHSVRPDGERIRTIGSRIASAALTPHSADWRSIEMAARASAAEEENITFATPLWHHLPNSPDAARALLRRIQTLPTQEPAWLERRRNQPFIRRSELALRGWMRCLNLAKEFDVWAKQADDSNGGRQKFLTIRHHRSSIAGHGTSAPQIFLPGIEPTTGHRAAYIDSRQDLASPPTRTVSLPEDPNTPLQFLDHGNPMHEALIVGWKQIGEKISPVLIEVHYPPGHSLATNAATGFYFVAIGYIDPAQHLLTAFDPTSVVNDLGELSGQQERQVVEAALAVMHDQYRADARWLNSLIEARIDVVAARFDHDAGWRFVSDPTIAPALLTPWVPGGRDLARSRNVAVPSLMRAHLELGRKVLAANLNARFRKLRSEIAGRLAEAVAVRRYLCEVETLEFAALRRAEVDTLRSSGADRSDTAFVVSRFRAATRALAMAEAAGRIRLARLEALAAFAVDAGRPMPAQIYKTALMRVMPVS